MSRGSASPETTRASLLFFFAKKGCRKEVTTVAKELLASRVPDLRARACSSLRGVLQTSLNAQIDPARKLESQDSGLWEYTYLTHPVREACQQALNELQLASR